ncbi:hypothetical protein BASA50_009078 [Batrachochytrium salamandrivorans]|uniref:DUF2415 domain-containing protein n=1 Tax=Batrachochytrium salamandrivorans TaxID=1357716 RepID=A0ABQ8F2U2_9FUNG|nr:hypothetical protein BASA62_009611 [Batrachochytrium salamandrivorans]KAH6578514.1 hypothetical protein BASA61_000272 [Batrachochytrium salamandrivorans]KAH6591078.1 hypothetical protein BASA50_009078 [Batrachochytrium salamandrivorans]KAH9277351.1 hypothetical protein BASA83_000218 [Batrachochytrium salamandrivorans]
MESGLRRLRVRAVAEGLPLQGLEEARPWRMNLLAVSDNDPHLLFIALHDYIHCYQTLHGQHQPQLHLMHVLRTHTGSPINAIRIGKLGSEEVLISVDDIGQIRVYFTENLHRAPVPMSTGVSTWGCATYGPGRLLAVSSNAHTIRIWDMSAHVSNTPVVLTPDLSSHNMQSEEQLAQASSDIDTIFENNEVNNLDHIDEFGHALGEGVTSRELLGHGHNVPCIDFTPNGQYLISCSIDETCRIWDVMTGACIIRKQIGSAWNWTCKSIETRDIKSLHFTDRVWSEPPGSSFNPFTNHTPSYQEAEPFLSRLYQALVNGGHRVLSVDDSPSFPDGQRTSFIPRRDVPTSTNDTSDRTEQMERSDQVASQFDSDEGEGEEGGGSEGEATLWEARAQQWRAELQNGISVNDRQLVDEVTVAPGFTASEAWDIQNYSQGILRGVMDVPLGAALHAVADVQRRSLARAHERLALVFAGLDDSGSDEREDSDDIDSSSRPHMASTEQSRSQINGETDDGDNEWEDTSFETSSIESIDVAIGSRLVQTAISTEIPESPPIRASQSVLSNSRNVAAEVHDGTIEGFGSFPRAISSASSVSPRATAFKRRRIVESEQLTGPIQSETALPALLPQFMILYTTTDDLLLLNGQTLAVECRVPKILAGWHLQQAYRGLERLSMCEWIPELSMAVVASQRGKLALIRLLRTKGDCRVSKFTMRLECWLPIQTESLAPLLGVSVSRQVSKIDASLSFFRVYIVTYENKLYVYEVSTESDLPIISHVCL